LFFVWNGFITFVLLMLALVRGVPVCQGLALARPRLVGFKMLTHGWLEELLGPNFNLYLLVVVLGILGLGILASSLHRESKPSRPSGTVRTTDLA
jgi:hypothetical protein